MAGLGVCGRGLEVVGGAKGAGGGRWGLWRKNQWQLSELELGGVNWLRGVARRMWAWPGYGGVAKGRACVVWAGLMEREPMAAIRA